MFRMPYGGGRSFILKKDRWLYSDSGNSLIIFLIESAQVTVCVILKLIWTVIKGVCQLKILR